MEKDGKVREYLTVLAQHPSLAGLIFSMLTQFDGKAIILNENGEISRQKLPDYYVVGDTNEEKIVCAFFYWLFALAADEVMSKRHVLDELGISKELIKKIKEFANLSFMKKIPANYEEAEKAFSEWMGNTIIGAEFYADRTDDVPPLFGMMGIALDLAEESFPVIINECIVRSLYVLIRFCNVVKEKQITSFEELADISPVEILPTDGRVISRMCLIASASFVGANVAGAALKAIKGKKAKGRGFAKNFFAELNYAGIGRFVFACAADAKYWGEDIRIILQKDKNKTVEVESDEDPHIEDNSAFESMTLDAIQ